jgi:hypothetical protein
VTSFYLNLKNTVFWDVSSCGSCRNWHFGRTYCLHFQVETIIEWHVPPKRWFLQEPHGDTPQKMAFFIVTAVKTSYLKLFGFVWLHFYKYKVKQGDCSRKFIAFTSIDLVDSTKCFLISSHSSHVSLWCRRRYLCVCVPSLPNSSRGTVALG